MAYENFYEGSHDLFNPNYALPTYKPKGYQADLSQISMSTDPRTANQLAEFNTKINPGMKHLEVSGVFTNVMEAIPDPHLEEIGRAAKLAGIKPSLHGPLVEASGIDMQKGRFDELNRFGTEEQLKSAVLRSHKIDPEGNISVTVHSTHQLPETEERIKTKEGERLEQFGVVDTQKGGIAFIPREKAYFPEEGKFEPEKEREFKPETALKKINEENWTRELAEINRYANFGGESIENVRRNFPDEVINKIAKGADLEQLRGVEKELFKKGEREITHGRSILRESYRGMKQLFDRAWVGASGEDKQKLKSFAEQAAPHIKNGIENDPTKLEEFGEIIGKGLKVLGGIKTPETYKPLKEFVIEKSAQTFGNVAAAAYKEFGNTAPILNIENPPAGGGLSRADDLKQLIIASRKKMEENLRKDGMSGGAAREAAEKSIGATWDVGHINMIRKKGYTEKEIVEETKKIAPFVKHVHLSDNFGLDHTELPMGMGNVPFKKMMDEIEKAGFKRAKVIEAGDWWQHFADKGGGNPFKPSIESFDSPVYAMKTGPTWYQTSGLFTGYYAGYGPINPPIHHQQFGAGFQQLPVELGGEIPGGRDRLTGRPME